MKNNLSLKCRIALLIAASSIVSACYEQVLTPSQTVEQFWSALISGDVNKAGDYTSQASRDAVLTVGEQFKDTTITFGEIQIETSRAAIETTLTEKAPPKAGGKAVSTTFNTILDKQQELWKVNYLETRKSLDDAKQKKGLSRLVDDLEKLGRDVTGQLGGVLKNWEKVAPEIKKDLETLGESVQKQLQESIDKHGPELQEKLQDFSQSLDEAIKDLEKGVPAPKQEEQQEEEAEQPGARMI